MNIVNHKPSVLVPDFVPCCAGDPSVEADMKKVLVTPLFEPLIPTAPCSIRTNQGADLTEDDVLGHIVAACGDTTNYTETTWCRTLFHDALADYEDSTNITIRELFLAQGAKHEGLAPPSANVRYSAGVDVQPVAAELLSGRCTPDKFLVSLGFYARPQTLGFYFINQVAFDEFKTWLNTELQTINAMLTPETSQMFSDFSANITLKNLTESLLLRTNDGDNNEPFSFARVLVSKLMQYRTVAAQDHFNVMPFDLAELFNPRSVVFVNVENHAHATPREISEEWELIQKSLSMPYTVMSNRQITNLTSLARTLNKLASSPVNNGTISADVCRAMSGKFKNLPPSRQDLYHSIMHVMKNMTSVNRSENSYKASKMTFQRPNRRDPDDFNRPGRMVSVKFRPDIHLYVDTSGSISEENYEGTVRDCIAMARKLNINLYFNSFSSVMSQTTKLHTKDRSAAQIYAEFQRIPKVTGGTRFDQVWEYIQASEKRRRELSLMITDFEYAAPNRFIKHPKNLYYAPCAGLNWDLMKDMAKQFCESMEHNDPLIRQKLIF